MRARRLWWGMAALTATLIAASVGFATGNAGTRLPADEGGGTVSLVYDGSFGVMSVAFAALGALLATRRPRNPIGPILGVAALAQGVSAVVSGWYRHGHYAEPGSSVPPEALVWVGGWIWAFGTTLPTTALLLLFPDGRLPSRRWRVAGLLVWASLAALVLGHAFEPGRMTDYPRQENPLGLPGALGDAAEVLREAGSLYLLAVAGSVAALAVRFRRSHGLERQQLRWMAAAAALTFCFLFGNVVLAEGFGFDDGWVLFPLVLIAIPAAAAVAILRYRLYDLGRVVNRALVYGALTATLGGAYLGLVLLIGVALGRSSDLAIAASTLAVAALFGPARRRIQALVDRRFYRRRYDAARTLEAFGGRLRDEVDLEALADDLRGVVGETVQPTHATLWLRGPGR